MLEHLTSSLKVMWLHSRHLYITISILCNNVLHIHSESAWICHNIYAWVHLFDCCNNVVALMYWYSSFQHQNLSVLTLVNIFKWQEETRHVNIHFEKMEGYGWKYFIIYRYRENNFKWSLWKWTIYISYIFVILCFYLTF